MIIAYTLYQLPSSNEHKFLGYNESTFNGIDYVGVYTGTINSAKDTNLQICEKLFEKFNVNPPEHFAGHSMSISDVIRLDNGGEVKYYYCVGIYGFT